MVQAPAGWKPAIQQVWKPALHCEKIFCHVLSEPDGPTYAEVGTRLGLKEDAVKQAVHRMRRRYRELFREEIAQTVAGTSEVEAELKYLFAVLSG